MFNHLCSDFEVPSSLVSCQLNPILYNAANRKKENTNQTTELPSLQSVSGSPLFAKWNPQPCSQGSPTHNPILLSYLISSRDFVFEDWFPWYCRSTSSILLLLFTSFHFLKHSFLSIFIGKILACALRSSAGITFMVSLLISSDWLCAL